MTAIIKLTTAGTLIPTTNVAGRNKALMTVMKEIADTVSTDEDYPIVIMHGDCLQDAERIATKLQSMVPSAKIITQYVGPVIGSHCGPGTIGIIFVGQKRPDPIED